MKELIEEEKAALETTYYDTVNIYRNVKTVEGNITKMKRQKINEKPIDCALSYKSSIAPSLDGKTNNLKGVEVLFLSYEIKKGDELEVTTLDGVVHQFIAGLPSYHLSHYEVPLEVRERA